jgi:hypothetical protein
LPWVFWKLESSLANASWREDCVEVPAATDTNCSRGLEKLWSRRRRRRRRERKCVEHSFIACVEQDLLCFCFGVEKWSSETEKRLIRPAAFLVETIAKKVGWKEFFSNFPEAAESM